MRLLSIVRSVAAVAIGYMLMGLLITLVQETWFGGVSYTGSPAGVLMAAGSLTILAAVTGGYAAGWIAGHHPVWHGAAMSVLVAIETTWLITSGRTHDPIWFDVMAAGSLVVGLLIGSSLRWCQVARLRAAAGA